jgi:phenylalanyl-tRNA synthetase beta chain
MLGQDQVGWLGKLHPAIADRIDIPTNVFVFQIELRALQMRSLPKFELLSKFPSVRRDLSLTVEKQVSAAQVLEAVRASDHGGRLVDCRLFDVYEGDGLDAGMKSVALGLTFQESSSTLNDEAVEPLVERILSKLKQEVGAILRS